MAAETKILRPLRRGQITIPAEFRRKLHIGDDTLLELTLHESKIEITPVVTAPVDQAWLRELYELFAPVREQAQGLSEVEIDAAIEDAIAEIRAGK